MSEIAKFPPNFRCLVSGSSQCGKTSLITEVLCQKRCFTSIPTKIYYVFGARQPTHIDRIIEAYGAQNVILINDQIPPEMTKEGFFNNKETNLLVFDDGYQHIDSSMETLFYKISHHSNCSIFLLIQTLLCGKNSSLHMVQRNLTHIILFRIGFGVNHIELLTLRLFGKQSKPHFMQIYNTQMEIPYNYIVVNLNTSSSTLQIYNNILLERQPPYIHVFPLKFPLITQFA